MDLDYKIKKLLKQVIYDSDSDIEERRQGYASHVIPDKLANEVNEGQFIILEGEEYKKFCEILSCLLEDRRAEHLKEREIKELLWFLIIDVQLHRKEYLSGDAKVAERIDEFLDEVFKPLQTVEIIYRVEGLKEVESNFDLPTGRIIPLTQDQLDKWKNNETGLVLPEIEDNWAGCSGLVVEGEGTKTKFIEQRAREKAEKSLSEMKIILSGSKIYGDKNLQFRLSEKYLVRHKDRSNYLSSGWSQKDYTKRKTGVPQDLTEPLKNHRDALGKISKFSDSLQNRIENSIDWIGRAMEMISFDEKVVSCFTAMETLLVRRSESNKGAWIAFRSVGLSLRNRDHFTDPVKLYSFYEEIRSKVIHGSERGVATDSEYKTTLRCVIRLLKDYIELVDKEDRDSFNQTLNYLEEQPEMEQAKEWLREESHDISEKILNEVEPVESECC